MKDDDNKDENDPEDDDLLDDDFEDDDDDDDDEIGVTDVIIEDSGLCGYEAYPYGDKGGMGRVWS